MSKYKITIEVETEEELILLAKYQTNHHLIESIYDEVFRPIIRYGEDEEVAEAYTLVWEKLDAYLKGVV
jgi:hypothetical protein